MICVFFVCFLCFVFEIFLSRAYMGPAFVLLSVVGETLSWLYNGKGGVGRILYVCVSRHEP